MTIFNSKLLNITRGYPLFFHDFPIKPSKTSIFNSYFDITRGYPHSNHLLGLLQGMPTLSQDTGPSDAAARRASLRQSVGDLAPVLEMDTGSDVCCFINQYWLVVSKISITFHFIYGMSSFPLTFIFFKMVKTTNSL